MQNNNVIAKSGSFVPWTEERLWQAVEQVSAETGFIAGGEVQRRCIYERGETWRVRIEGVLHGTRASLRLECLKFETDEEEIRRAFRAQASGTAVRPPRTFAHRSFDESRGYAWSLDEMVDDPPLFQPGDLPEVAATAFVPFYRELRQAVREPFWPAPDMDAQAFSQRQFAEWHKLAEKRFPKDDSKRSELLGRLERAVTEQMAGRALVFRHAHLAGGDVRTRQDAWIVFANFFWSWRQPGYDLAFAIWNQWMALSEDRRHGRGVKDVTETWLTAIRASCHEWVEAQDVQVMLLNRCYGSLLLDVPAKRGRHSEPEVTAWESAIVAEAERLLAAG